MKRILLLCAIWSGTQMKGHAQAMATWLEQLAALQTLNQTVTDGYAIEQSGLETIGDVQDAEYGLHSDYLQGLSTVSAAIDNDPKTVDLRNLLNELIRRLNDRLDYWQKQEPIPQP